MAAQTSLRQCQRLRCWDRAAFRRHVRGREVGWNGALPFLAHVALLGSPLVKDFDLVGVIIPEELAAIEMSE